MRRQLVCVSLLAAVGVGGAGQRDGVCGVWWHVCVASCGPSTTRTELQTQIAECVVHAVTLVYCPPALPPPAPAAACSLEQLCALMSCFIWRERSEVGSSTSLACAASSPFFQLPSCCRVLPNRAQHTHTAHAICMHAHAYDHA